jgi:flagellar biosynthesis protein FliP
MAQVELPQVAFTDPEAPEISEYRPLNQWVVLAVALTVLSLSAFLMPIFWIFPLLAVIVSFVALRSLLDETRPTSGRRGAVMALVLSLFILGCAPVRYITVMMMTANQGRAHAEAWLAMVQEGRLHEAHQLSLDLYSRVAPHEDLEQHYRARPDTSTSSPSPDSPMAMMAAFSPPEELRNFFNQPGLKNLVAAGKEAEVEFVRSAGFEPSQAANLTVVDLRYVVRYVVDGKPQRSRLRILMERAMVPQSGVTHWRVKSVDDMDALGIKD